MAWLMRTVTTWMGDDATLKSVNLRLVRPNLEGDVTYYTLRVPTEAARGAGDEVLDFSGFFQATQGAGINIEVRDAAGNLLRSGERFRVQAQQRLLREQVRSARSNRGPDVVVILFRRATD